MALIAGNVLVWGVQTGAGLAVLITQYVSGPPPCFTTHWPSGVKLLECIEDEPCPEEKKALV
jgi:hypothetical protein